MICEFPLSTIELKKHFMLLIAIVIAKVIITIK